MWSGANARVSGTPSVQRSQAASDRRFLWIAILPAALILFFVGVVPLLYAGWLSLHDYDLIHPPQLFIGLENYRELLGDDRFRYAMAFTFAFAFAATCLEVGIGFLIAWLLADRQIPGWVSSGSRTLMLVPYMVAPVVMAYIFKTLIYDANFGYLSDVLVRLGQPPFIMFEGFWKPILCLLAMDVVLRMPFVVLILYAGITTVPPEQLEAASVDGANLRQRIVRIVLPALRPIILIAFVFRFMDALKIFDEIWVITGGGPGRTTESVSVFASKTAFTQFKMGYATASSLIFAVTVLVLTMVILRGTRFEVES
jgi:multiple sugar transport system permease protein